MRDSKRQFKLGVRKLKRCHNTIQDDKFLKSILEGNCNIYSEVKRLRGNKSSSVNKIDNIKGSVNISNHFAGIYSALFNNANCSFDDYQKTKQRIISNVSNNNMKTIEKVNSELVQEAMSKLKPKKSDALFDVVSDMYLNGPVELSENLSLIIQSCLVHGRVPKFLLVCQIVPLIKNTFEDHCSSTNYRAIASGCLLLKIIDQVFIILEGEKMGFDQLQFAYQHNTSTNMCTWAVSNVVEYFNKRGSSVFAASMDMTKAFDNVSWSRLFSTLEGRKIDVVFLRLMMFIYENQTCKVKWGGSLSEPFTVRNGVRQGAVSSSFFFTVYIVEILKILRRKRMGYHINGFFLGAFLFAYDIILLSASRNGLQSMVNTCIEFRNQETSLLERIQSQAN